MCDLTGNVNSPNDPHRNRTDNINIPETEFTLLIIPELETICIILPEMELTVWSCLKEILTIWSILITALNSQYDHTRNDTHSIDDTWIPKSRYGHTRYGNHKWSYQKWKLPVRFYCKCKLTTWSYQKETLIIWSILNTAFNLQYNHTRNGTTVLMILESQSQDMVIPEMEITIWSFQKWKLPVRFCCKWVLTVWHQQ